MSPMSCWTRPRTRTYAGQIEMTLRNGRLVLVASDPGLASLKITGAQPLGFQDVQDADRLGFTTIQEMITLLATQLGVSPALLAVTYDPTTRALTFDLPQFSHGQTIADAPFGLQMDLGSLADVVTNSTVTIASEVQGSFDLGFVLAHRRRKIRSTGVLR